MVFWRPEWPIPSSLGAEWPEGTQYVFYRIPTPEGSGYTYRYQRFNLATQEIDEISQRQYRNYRRSLSLQGKARLQNMQEYSRRFLYGGLSSLVQSYQMKIFATEQREMSYAEVRSDPGFQNAVRVLRYQTWLQQHRSPSYDPEQLHLALVYLGRRFGDESFPPGMSEKDWIANHVIPMYNAMLGDETEGEI